MQHLSVCDLTAPACNTVELTRLKTIILLLEMMKQDEERKQQPAQVAVSGIIQVLNMGHLTPNPVLLHLSDQVKEGLWQEGLESFCTQIYTSRLKTIFKL